MQHEITFKSLDDLPVLINYIQEARISSISLTNKKNTVSNLLAIVALHQYLPFLEIIPHYSITMNYHGSAPSAAHNVKYFIEQVDTLDVKNVLLVSGSQPKHLDSLGALDYLSSELYHSDEVLVKPKTRISVAYNPYLSGEALIKENKRLAKKLEYDFVDQVYIQIGTDVEKLTKGIETINELQTQKVKIYGCLLEPSLAFLNSFKYRPWHGVFLPQDYLNDINLAEKYTQEIKNCYDQNKISYLVESFEIFKQYQKNYVV